MWYSRRSRRSTVDPSNASNLMCLNLLLECCTWTSRYSSATQASEALIDASLSAREIQASRYPSQSVARIQSHGTAVSRASLLHQELLCCATQYNCACFAGRDSGESDERVFADDHLFDEVAVAELNVLGMVEC